MTTIRVFKVNEHASLPVYSTEWSACFDLSACLKPNRKVVTFDQYDNKVEFSSIGTFPLSPGVRALIPTGLIFDLDEGQSLRVKPRSGLAWKNGITVLNCEGVIDADYTEETFVMLHNTTHKTFFVEHGMRIAQGEIVKVQQVGFDEIDTRPAQKTSRVGGLGSTGL